MTDCNSEIILEPLPQVDPARRQPDVSVAWAEPGWEPKVVFDNELESTVEFF